MKMVGNISRRFIIEKRYRKEVEEEKRGTDERQKKWRVKWETDVIYQNHLLMTVHVHELSFVS